MILEPKYHTQFYLKYIIYNRVKSVIFWSKKVLSFRYLHAKHHPHLKLFGETLQINITENLEAQTETSF